MCSQLQEGSSVLLHTREELVRKNILIEGHGVGVSGDMTAFLGSRVTIRMVNSNPYYGPLFKCRENQNWFPCEWIVMITELGNEY